jgi:hypothetical protein
MPLRLQEIKAEVRAFLERVAADYATATDAIVEAESEVRRKEVDRLVGAVQESARALLVAAELVAQPVDRSLAGDRPVQRVMDEAAKMLVAATNALEEAHKRSREDKASRASSRNAPRKRGDGVTLTVCREQPVTRR